VVFLTLRYLNLHFFFFLSSVGTGRGSHEGAIIQYIKYACMHVYIYKEREKERVKKLQNP